MSVIAVSTAVGILALVGLLVGLIVFFVVIWLLQGVLSPLRKVLFDVREALTAPLLERGTVQGTDQLDRTQRLAQSVPDLAVAYLQKLGLPVNTDKPATSFPEPGTATRHGQGGWR